MCGILALLGNNSVSPADLKLLEALVDKRGPDYQSSIEKCHITNKLDLLAKASVLHLRGKNIQNQPLVDQKNNVLLFNGQVYKFLGVPLEEGISDTKFLAEKLLLCASENEIAETFAEIDGPFAFIYWNNDLKSLFYGRDLFGRKSLCVLLDNNLKYPIAISSLATQPVHSKTNQSWSEVDCSGLHCISFLNPEDVVRIRFLWNLDCIFPRTERCQSMDADENVNCIFLKSRPLAPLNPDSRSEFNHFEQEIAPAGLGEKLIQAVELRIQNDIDRCLLCRDLSGTDHSDECNHSKIAVAFSGGIDSTLLALALDKVAPKNETIDLVTVAFKENSPDRISVGEAFKELRSLCPLRNWRLVLCDINKLELERERSQLIRHLISPCQTVIDDSLGCACWFIGRAKGRSIDSDIDDGMFNEIFERFLDFQDNSSPVMNESATKLNLDYTSPATMFFVGSSIDEQLGGYGSHRIAWSKSKIQGVYDEISFLMRRISSRNLGRDDRVYSDHGRDVKLPYLDYDLVSYLNQLPISLKMNLDESSDIGPKKLLRELAYHWGLRETSKRVKRALQFGTRIANLENPKEKGDDVCLRLT